MAELEAKYLLTGGRELPGKRDKSLRRLLQELFWAGYAVIPKGAIRIRDTYYDTPDWHLQRAGWSLRSRTGNGCVVITLKQIAVSQSGMFERQELEQRLFDAEWDINHLSAGDVADLLKTLLPTGIEVAVLFKLRNERTRYQLSHRDYSRSEMELSMDVVRIRSKTLLEFVEFECELIRGPENSMTPAAAVMRQQPGFLQARVGKYQRGLQATGCDFKAGLVQLEIPTSPNENWATLGLLHLRVQAQQLNYHEPLAWEGLDLEGVHEMRVATRRVRAALQVFSNVLPRAESTTLSDEIRWLGRILGRVRDLDVQLVDLARYKQHLHNKETPGLSAYGRRLQANRRLAHTNLIQALTSDRYRALPEKFRALREARMSLAESQQTIEETARAIVKPQLRAIRKRGRKITRSSPPEALHRLRIEIKRLRYQLEYLAEPYGKPLAATTIKLRRLQQTLGEHHDACVARDQLKVYRRRHKLKPGEIRAIEKLRALASSNGRKHRKQFAKDWRKFEAEARQLKKVFS